MLLLSEPVYPLPLLTTTMINKLLERIFRKLYSFPWWSSTADLSSAWQFDHSEKVIEYDKQDDNDNDDDTKHNGKVEERRMCGDGGY